jgi:hypothetical protein
MDCPICNKNELSDYTLKPQFDKRYSTKYFLSLIGNLNEIKNFNLFRLVKTENTRCVCPQCGNINCIQNRNCYQYQNNPLPLYRISLCL